MPLAALDQLDVRPGDDEAVDQVEEWFRVYHATRIPAVRDRIILAHLGLADRSPRASDEVEAPATETLCRLHESVW